MNRFVVEAEGCSGGLALFWTSNININMVFFSRSYIEVNIFDYDGYLIWRFLVIYGFPIASERWKSWDLVLQYVTVMICF